MTILSEIQNTPEYVPIWPNPDMSILKGVRQQAPPLPLQVFGPLAEWLAQAAEVKNTPVDYCATALLTVSASLIGNSRKVTPWQGWEEPAILWTALIGRPSSGKSPALDAILEPVRLIQSDLQAEYPAKKIDYETCLEVVKNEKAKWEADVKEAVKKNLAHPPKPAAACEPEKPALPRLMVNDSTIEAIGLVLKDNPRGILLNRDELAGWLENMGRYGSHGGDRGFWIECFGGRPFSFGRVKNHHDPVLIDRLSVSITGGIQPDRLASVMMDGDDDGLAARFLYVWPEPIPPKRPTGNYDQGLVLHTFNRLYGLTMQEQPQVMTLTPEAANLFQHFREELARAEEDASGLLLGHIGKMSGMALRISLVLELLWWAAGSGLNPPEQITQQALVGACALISNYFLPMARRAFGDAALPESEKNACALARWIFKHKPRIINSRAILRGPRIGTIGKAAQLHSALDELEDAGWIVPCSSRAGESQGKTRNDYAVNPKLLEVSAS
jgi:hypothetical protein